MSSVSNIGDVYHWSIARIAEAFSIDRKAVKRLLLEANIPVAGTVKGNAVYALKDVGPALFTRAVACDPEGIHDPSKMEPKERKDWFQSENERIKLEKEQRGLIPVNEVVTVYSAMTKSVVQVLDTIPDILERDCALNPQAVAVVQTAIDDLRTTLSERSYHACAIDLMGDKGEVIVEED